jgi:hypothetical protein
MTLMLKGKIEKQINKKKLELTRANQPTKYWRKLIFFLKKMI